MKTNNKAIKGFKFHQQALHRLRVELYDAVDLPGYTALTCSEIAVYVLYHNHCDEFGRILEGAYSYRELATLYHMNASTIHEAHHKLIERGMLRISTINHQSFIEIVHYADWNTTEKETTSGNNSLNYFKIPHIFLYSLKDYIRSRDAKGMLYVLSMMNQTYRENSIRSTAKRELLQDTLKRKARKTNRTLNKFLSRVAKVFHINVTNSANDETKYIFSFAANCFTELKEAPSHIMRQQKIRKDITHQFTESHLTYNKKDINDVFYSVKSELLDPIERFYANAVGGKLRRSLDRLILLAYREAMENLMQAKQIKSVGAYFRQLLRGSTKRYLAFHMDHNDLINFFSYLKIWGVKSSFTLEDILALKNQ